MSEPTVAAPPAVPHSRQGRPDAVADTTALAPEDRPPSRIKRLLLHPGTLAVVTFALAGIASDVIAALAPYGGGAQVRTAALPLAAGGAAMIVIVALALRRPSPWLAGITAGGLGAWMVLIFAMAMRGTPMPVYGLLGDSGRLTAMATRYSTTWASADAWVKGQPGEYPPLFPWVVGRISALTDIPAWQLVGQAEVWFTGAAIVGGFVLWLRLVKPWTAVMVTLAAFMIFAIPAKAYEVITLLMFTPWVIGTFGNPPRGRLHWFVSGVVGAFLVLTYYGWLVLGGIGAVVIAIMALRREADRRGYLLHVLKVIGVATILSSWFVVPLFVAKFTGGGENVADLYGSSSLLDQMLPFFDFTWIGLIQLVGLVGLIWLRGRVWWATPLLTLVLGAYAFRLLGAIVFVLTNHTLIAHYTRSVYMSVLMSAGVLTLVHAVPRLLKRLSLTPPKHGVTFAMAILIGWAGFTITLDWMPGMRGRYSDYVERAYREPLPDGRYTADFQPLTPWFPVGPIQRQVEQVRGDGELPVAISVDERLFSFLPWYGYLGTDTATSSMTRPFDRLAELQKLSDTKDPAAFSRLAAQTAFGEIDIFVLKREAAQRWTWTFAYGYGQKPLTLAFGPEQFAASDWVVADMPQDVVVAVRRKG